jgi:hypothetical protein
MKLKSGVTFLGLLCVVLATPASAAKITIGDQGGYVDVGAIVQTWARMEQNGNAHHDGVSTDIFFRRMRIYVNAALNEHIGVIVNTDVSYSQTYVTPQTGIVTNPTTQIETIRFNQPTVVLNEGLGYYAFCKEFIFMAGQQLIPWVHESFEDVQRFGSLDEQTDVTQRGRPGGNAGGFQSRNRDMGIAFRGLLFNEILGYRIGVFNGTQTALGAVGTTASGLAITPALGTANGITFPAYAGVNPGDSPSFDGMIRINIVGSEAGYAYCGLCNDGKSYFSVGFGANVQPRGVIAPSRASPGATYAAYFADLFLDLPFGDNEFILEGGWVRNVYSGNGAPISGAAGLALINNAGDGFFGHVGMRFAWFYPYFAFEDYKSNLPDAYVTSTFVQFGNGGLAAAGRVGSLQTYHVGIKILGSPAPSSAFNIDLDVAFQSKANAGNIVPTVSATEPINGNQWVTTLAFNFKI